MIKIYVDDNRFPVDDDWIICRNYEEFINLVKNTGLDNISIIQLDHDLDITASKEYFKNVLPNYFLDYNNIKEKTGRDCALFLKDYYYECNPSRIGMNRNEKKKEPFIFPEVYTHSANSIGSANIIGIINTFYANEGRTQSCIRNKVDFYE